MKGMRKLILVMIMAVALVAPSVHAAPQPLTDAQIEQIRRNCQGSQSFLQQIQRNDAAARINRGRIYESLGKLLTNFNSRVVLNKLDAPSLVTASSAFTTKVSAFQSDYLSYEDTLSRVLKVKCEEQPVTFYDTLTQAREQRAKLSKDIQDINAILDTYQQGVTALRGNLVEAAAKEAIR